jgi:hypothetical protein
MASKAAMAMRIMRRILSQKNQAGQSRRSSRLPEGPDVRAPGFSFAGDIGLREDSRRKRFGGKPRSPRLVIAAGRRALSAPN